MTALPFALETPLERTLAADPIWQRGVQWGTPRPGHLEGQVMYHIADVLANVERQATSPEERAQLRLIALVHDTLKYQVDTTHSRTGANHHAARARAWAAHYIDDPHVLRVTELHDAAYHIWRFGNYTGQWDDAEDRLDTLLNALGEDVPLFVRFFRSDTDTSSKNPEPGRWLEAALRSRGISVPANDTTDGGDTTHDRGRNDTDRHDPHGHHERPHIPRRHR